MPARKLALEMTVTMDTRRPFSSRPAIIPRTWKTACFTAWLWKSKGPGPICACLTKGATAKFAPHRTADHRLLIEKPTLRAGVAFVHLDHDNALTDRGGAGN